MEENEQHMQLNQKTDLSKNSMNLLNNTQGSIFISHLDKESIKNTKVENINDAEINYPSINHRIDMSYFSDNENYFKNSIIEENHYEMNKEKNLINNNKSTEHSNGIGLPSKTELNINVKESIKENSELRKFSYTSKEILSVDQKELTLPYYLVAEKCEVKDVIGFHKLYELQLYEVDKDKRIQCFRRYNHFSKLDAKLRRKYPYMIIPRLTPKNPLVKILSPEKDFYENRRMQLNFYQKFLYKNEFLSKTKDFIRFTNEAEFEEEYFMSNEDEITFPESLKITDTIKNKIFGVFSGIFGSKQTRKPSDEEILLRRMETHYRSIAEKYREIKNNIVFYLKTLKLNADGYKLFSDTCYYMKDTLEGIPNAKESFKVFHEISQEVSDINRKHHQISGICLENKFEGFISLLLGLCDTFDRYNEFTKTYENVLKAFKYAKTNKLDNLNVFVEELKMCDEFKQKFDRKFLIEINKFVETFNNTFSDLIEEFKLLLKSLNSQVKIVSHNINVLEI